MDEFSDKFFSGELTQSIDKTMAEDREKVAKGLNGEEKAYSEPVLGAVNMNPDFVERPNTYGFVNTNRMLKLYSGNSVLNAIINTRSNQVSLFAQPVRYSEKGQGFELRLKDFTKKPSKRQEKEMAQIEEFLMNTGVAYDGTRDDFNTFLRKLVRDTYTYDQVNYEKVFDEDGRLLYFKMVDPTTIYYAKDKDGKTPKKGAKYLQIYGNKIRAGFKDEELAFSVRNPRSDIEASKYGYSELEIGLKHFISQQNTETFNDRFFSNGGTTRGVLQIKTDSNQSQQQLDNFKRQWKNTLSGMNGSWQIPVVNAEDVKFVNMTPTARDMEFESWLNYNINIICSLYSIDPAEINFPNRGGATGSSAKGGTIIEQTANKSQASQNKGLLPLLKFIEGSINKNIIHFFSDEYRFQFVGGDAITEAQKIEILSQKVQLGMTANEARRELGLQGDVPGGDVPLNGVSIQRAGQIIQQDNFEYQRQQDNVNRLLESTGDIKGSNSAPNSNVTFQDIQQGLNGNADNVNGKDTMGNVGKDGQDKTQPNANSAGEGGKDRNQST